MKQGDCAENLIAKLCCLLPLCLVETYNLIAITHTIIQLYLKLLGRLHINIHAESRNNLTNVIAVGFMNINMNNKSSLAVKYFCIKNNDIESVINFRLYRVITTPTYFITDR